jgi:hypothetical protein
VVVFCIGNFPSPVVIAGLDPAIHRSK